MNVYQSEVENLNKLFVFKRKAAKKTIEKTI